MGPLDTPGSYDHSMVEDVEDPPVKVPRPKVKAPLPPIDSAIVTYTVASR